MARKRKVNPELIDEDSPEWTNEDFARARPLAEAMPGLMRKVRGKQKAPTKELISIRLSQDVLGKFRASGPGWQGQVDDALRQWLKRHLVRLAVPHYAPADQVSADQEVDHSDSPQARTVSP